MRAALKLKPAAVPENAGRIQSAASSSSSSPALGFPSSSAVSGSASRCSDCASRSLHPSNNIKKATPSARLAARITFDVYVDEGSDAERQSNRRSIWSIIQHLRGCYSDLGSNPTLAELRFHLKNDLIIEQRAYAEGQRVNVLDSGRNFPGTISAVKPSSYMVSLDTEGLHGSSNKKSKLEKEVHAKNLRSLETGKNDLLTLLTSKII